MATFLHFETACPHFSYTQLFIILKQPVQILDMVNTYRRYAHISYLTQAYTLLVLHGYYVCP